MSYKLVKMALVASLMCVHIGAPAEDIDLFVREIPETQKPNVLIVLDNTANWNQAFSNEMSALVSALDKLPDDKFNVGLMLFTESGGENGSPGGAYVRAAVRRMNSETKEIYMDLFESLDKLKDKGDSATFGLAMAEAYRYFAGAEAYAGHNKVKRDYDGNEVDSYSASNRVYELTGNALPNATSSTYISPINGTCQQNIIIFISNGPSDLGENSGNTPATLLTEAGGDATMIPLSPSGRQDIVADEWARFLATNDINKNPADGLQNVKTYTVDVDPKTTGQGPDNTALLRSMARQGRGSYFSVSSANGGGQVAEALKRIFSEIQSVDSAFASASLPVSVNAQGTYLNQVFIGMFRPESTPRWFGNLKQYQFRADVSANGDVINLTLADKLNEPAINAQNGFIQPCARSFWSTGDTYWPSDYLGSCIDTDVRSNSPDGEIIEKGAVAQRLRILSGATGATARKVKTCSGCGDGSSLDDFTTSSASITALTVTTAAEQSALVNWTRGQNVDNELAKGTSAIRPSVHGDVVHSRPLAIDYGGTTGVVVFYGSNDGMLRAVNGNKPDTAGNELWSFVAPEHYGKLKRLKSNSPIISFPGVTTMSPDPNPEPKDYFFDGTIGVYREGFEKVWIYPTMRRGGRYVYAFDVSTPSSPTLKWKRGPGQLANIGQTWSEPKVVKVAGYPSASTAKSPVVIMGGGYDPCEDQDAVTNTACVSPMGNRIYVLDADTGAVLKTLGTGVGDGDAILRSVAADVTIVDSDYDGYADVAYAVDTGANVYRINMGTSAPGSWTVNKIAALGCGSGHCGRKFLHAPEVVVSIGFNAVLVGSGNRERPLLSNQATNVDNAFFMIKDDRSTTPPVITASNLVSIDPDDVALSTEQKTQLASASNKGWYLAFGNDTHDKEQVVTSAVVVAGVAYFSTHTPKPLLENECSNLGLARGYAVNFLDATGEDGGSRFTVFSGGGLPPSPVAGVVTVALTGSDGSPMVGADGKPLTADVPFIIGGGGISGIDPTKVEVNPSGVRGRVYWYIDNE